MRRTASEKMEIIRLVEGTDLPVRATLRQLGVPRSTFYGWYQRYLDQGFGGLQAGKSVKWVAEVLGHADATMTLRVYAHAMPEDETDLSFADLNGDRRRYTATEEIAATAEGPNYAERMARREGFEPPTLRFEA